MLKYNFLPFFLAFCVSTEMIYLIFVSANMFTTLKGLVMVSITTSTLQSSIFMCL